MLALRRSLVVLSCMFLLGLRMAAVADEVKHSLPPPPTAEQIRQWLLIRDQQRAALAKGVSREKMAHLRALTHQERIDLVDGAYWDQDELMQELTNQLRNGKASPDEIFTAATLLGEYHMKEGIGEIVRFLTLENTAYDPTERIGALEDTIHMHNRWGHYPVEYALVEMGQPAVSYMIGNLATSDNEKVRNLSASVIRYVYSDLDLGKLVIQKATAREPDPTRKQRLQAALKYFGDEPIALD